MKEAMKAIQMARKLGYKEWYHDNTGVYRNESLIDYFINWARKILN